MGLKRALAGNWVSRITLVVWIISAIGIIFLLKSMELIVHGQLYYYGLQFSSEWADPYRTYTYLFYLCLGLPLALSGVALGSSFIKETEKVPEKKTAVQQNVRLQPPAKTGAHTIIKEKSRIFDNSISSEIECPKCKKTFSRTLEMLDFRSEKPRILNACPYCNHVLTNTVKKSGNGDFHVENTDKKVTH